MSTSKEKNINQCNAAGLREGYWEMYQKNNLIYKGNYINGEYDGWWEEYFNNGQLSAHGNYVNGEENGWWEDFNLEGEIVIKTLYINI